MSARITQLAQNLDAFVPIYAGYMKTCISSVHLSLTQLNALRAADRDPPATMAEIAKALRLTPYAVTKIVDALEKEHLVDRIPHPTDRRVTNVVLTPVGREFLDAGLERRQMALEDLVGALSAEDQDRLDNIIQVLTERASGLVGA